MLELVRGEDQLAPLARTCRNRDRDDPQLHRADRGHRDHCETHCVRMWFGELIPVSELDLTQVVTSVVAWQTGALPEFVASVSNAPPHGLTRCPDGLQSIEQG
jgi:hypothetical protein